MKYTTLPNTDLKISKLCLGTMTRGQQNTEAEAHEQLDFAIEKGINFIDCAEMYPVPANPNTQGRTETYIGNWLAKKKNRADLIITSKIALAEVWIIFGSHWISAKNLWKMLFIKV